MLVILEGADGSGKSTLAQELASYLGQTTSDSVEIRHAMRPDRHPLDEYLRPLRRYRPGEGQHIILDRWHWGEAVYPAVLGRETRQDDAVWWSIEAYLRRLGAVVVLCDRNLTMEYHDVYRRRGITMESIDSWQFTNLDRIRLAFQRLVYRSQLDTWSYRPGDGLSEAIVSSARHYEEKYRPLNHFTTYLGPAKPSVLLVGDVRNGVDPATTRDLDPAFVPFRGTSGHYLLEALAAQPSRDWLRSVGLANACDVDDVTELYDALGRPRVVALGKNAYAKLLTGGVDCSVVPHPQYVRRFHHKLGAEYAWAIVRASQTREDLSKWPLSSTETADARSTSTSSTRSVSSDAIVPAATESPAT